VLRQISFYRCLHSLIVEIRRWRYYAAASLLIFGCFVTAIGISAPAEAAVLDSYFENFDDFTDGASINDIEYWTVSQGGGITESGVTVSGLGQALKLIGSSTVVNAARSTSYGGLTPTWIRFSARPANSAQNPNVPASGIAAVCFAYDGKILVSDETSWVDTGKTYSIGQWYDAAMKLDFKTHTYDFYFTNTLVPDAQFLPVKTSLKFIDSSINSLSDLKFYGSYSSSLADDVYIDNLFISYIDRISVISSPQKLMINQISWPITAQLQNSLSEPQTAVFDITLELKSTSEKGKFSLNRDLWVDVEQIVISQDSQQAAFYYKDTLAGKPVITVSEYPDQGIITASQQQEIVTQVSYFDVEPASLRQIAGQNFAIDITAKDEEGGINELYSGSVVIKTNYVSPSSGGYKVLPDNVLGFSKGRITLSVSYPDCGSITITVEDSLQSSKTGTSPRILFLPAGFNLTTESSQIISDLFSFSISAKNVYGVVTPNYNSDVNLYVMAVSPQSAAVGILSPAVVSGGEFESGFADVNVSFNLYGTIKIRGEDSNDSTKQGISGEIDFLPQGVSVSVEHPAGGREFFYIGEPVGIIVTIEDYLRNPVVNYPGTVELSAIFGLELTREYTFTDEDAGSHKFLANPVQAGKYTVGVKAEESLTAESLDIIVKEAYIQVIDTVSPIGSGEVIIQIVDEFGNVITSEDGLEINVKFVEDIENNSVSLQQGLITLTEGRAVITVFNTEAETVTIVPSSPFEINVKKGTIIFGRKGKTGINALMWRELKRR